VSIQAGWRGQRADQVGQKVYGSPVRAFAGLGEGRWGRQEWPFALIRAG